VSTDGTDVRAGGDNEPGRSASMRLRAERPRVTRLSRKVLAGAAAVGSAAIFGATFWALQNNRSHTSAPTELYTTDQHNVADGLTGLPRDYAGVPRQAPPLGPALPGDLGRPILNAQNAPAMGMPAIDSEQQRLSQEVEAARLSRLFASTSIRELASSIAQVASVGASTIAPNQTSQPAPPPANDTFTQNGQDRKTRFRQRAARSSHHKSGSSLGTCIILCRASRQYHSGVTYYGHPLGSAWRDYGSGHRKCL
jgi:type IV secretion system protein TrbI